MSYSAVPFQNFNKAKKKNQEGSNYTNVYSYSAVPFKNLSTYSQVQASKKNHTSDDNTNYSAVPFKNFSKQPQTKKKIKVTECALCLKRFHFYQKKYRTKCGHKFHFTCLKNLSRSIGKYKEMSCPICRTNIEKDRFIIKNDGRLAYADWEEYRRINQSIRDEAPKNKEAQQSQKH